MLNKNLGIILAGLLFTGSSNAALKFDLKTQCYPVVVRFADENDKRNDFVVIDGDGDNMVDGVNYPNDPDFNNVIIPVTKDHHAYYAYQEVYDKGRKFCGGRIIN